MAEPQKLTTAEILALARQKKAEAAAAAAANSPAEEPAAQPPVQPSAETSGSTPPPAADAPKSTADILAAARAAKAAKSAAPAGGQPQSTADILAAARAKKGAAPAAAEAPKSTADILAAARAKKGAAPAPSAPAAKAGAGEVASAPAVPPAAGERPPLKEMVAVVKAANEGKPVAAAKPPVAAKPKLPAKEKISRRSAVQVMSSIAISPFVLAWVAMSAVAGAWGLGVARFMMPNMVLELPSQFKVGPPSDFPPGTVSEKYKASRGVWLVHSSQYDGRDIIYALLSICTHLGCTPNWLEGEQKFKCPCHGSGYYITGVNFEGPAPRPLERVGLRRADDGMLEVDKSLKFQEELGQWSDSKSYYQFS